MKKKLNMGRFLRALSFAALTTSLLSLCVVGVFARYKSDVLKTTTMTVSRMLFVGNEAISEDISADLPSFPGDSAEYKFTVSNGKDESTVAEVTLDYTVTVSDFGNLPFKYEILCESENSISESLEDAGTFSGKGTMQARTPTTHTYTLKVTWDAAENNAALADEIDCIKITVDAVQVN